MPQLAPARFALDRIAQARADAPAPPPRDVDTAAIVDRVLASIAGVILDRGALVTVDHLPVVSGHEAQLTALFRDLILNAISFAPRGVRPRLTVGAERTDGEWRFCIADRGDGRVSRVSFAVRDHG